MSPGQPLMSDVPMVSEPPNSWCAVAEPATPWSPATAIRISAGLHALALLGVGADPAAWPWCASAVAANHALMAAIGMWPRSRLLGPNLVRLLPAAKTRRQVALTFDDGPAPGMTPAVLDLLDRYGARASFFCIGRRAAVHPGLVREAIRRGHSVENHTDTHPLTFACMPPAALAREVGMAQARLTDITGVVPRFFRPPMGFRSPLLDPILARLGLRHSSWTRRGYDAVDGSAARVLKRLCRGFAAGDVLLLHDGARHRRAEVTTTLEVLPKLLTRLAEAGLVAVTLPAGAAET